MTPEEAQVVQDGRLAAGWDWCPDDMHDALEEKMSATIAGLQWEYGVQWDSDHISWLGTALPECRRSVEANRENEDLSPSVVRRPVGPVEVVDG